MPTRFEQELTESPQALLDLLAWSQGPGAEAYAAWRTGLAGIRRVIGLGMGTSSFAPATMRPGLARAGIRFHPVEAGEWLHSHDSPADGERLVLTSQSGASAEIVRLVERGLPAGTVAITNQRASPLGRVGAPAFLLNAGEEAAISTKTYLNTLATGHLLGAAVTGDLAAWHRRLAAAAVTLRSFDAAAVAQAAQILAGTQALAVVGRLHAAPAVQQFALTLAEGAAMAGVPFVGGSFRHGPLEAAGPGLGVVAFAPADATGDLVVRAAVDAARLRSPVVVLTDRVALPAGLLRIPVPPGVDAEDFSLRASRSQAQLVGAIAARRGREAGVFRVNSKITVTE